MIPRLALALACLPVSLLLTRWLRYYALRRALLDVPNERSAHAAPTPTGGGLAIAATCLLALMVAWALGWVPPGLTAALAGGGAVVAVVGWLDDRVGVSAPVRLGVQLAAALWAIAWLGGLPGLRLGGWTAPLGVAGPGLAVLGIVWATNLYNFMDGIDGLAAVEAVQVGGFGALLAGLSGDPPIALVGGLLAASAAGFLWWNRPPARIFMGDVGSGFLGFVLGALAVASENRGAVPLLAWAVLAGVFVFDATATLLRRLWRGESWWRAHRSHAYQRLALSGAGHATVTWGVAAANLLLATLCLVGVLVPWLLGPMALLSLAPLSAAYWRVERIARMPGSGR